LKAKLKFSKNQNINFKICQERLEANAILRERFLHFLNWTAGKQVTVKMFNGSQAEPVEGTMAAVDAHNFECIFFTSLKKIMFLSEGISW
jgi:hypothetical protein